MHVGGAGAGFTTQEEFRLFNAIFSDLLLDPTPAELATNDLTIVERYADQLFNDGSLEVVKLSVFKTDKIQGGQKELDYLAIGDGNVAIFYDTGIAPGNSINYPKPNVQFVQTAGNVFDEGTGGKGLTEGEYLTFPLPGQIIEFDADFMRSFGYRNLVVGVRFDGIHYELVITHTPPPSAGRPPWTIREKVHKNNKRVANGETNYFAGNRIKNAYIRSVLAMLSDGATIEEIQKWLISKGLGDLLQDLLMIAFAMLKPRVLCLGYSNDRVYSGRILRFLLENTGSVYNDPGKTDGFVTSNLRMQRRNEPPFTKWNRVFELLRQRVIAKNQHIINLLSLVFADANIVIRTIGAITRTPLILHLFRKIAETVSQANAFLSSAASFTPYVEGISEDQHNTNLILISGHEVIDFVEQIKTQKTTTVKFLPIKSFFIGRETESAVTDVLKVITTTTQHNLQTLITALNLRELMTTGGYDVPAAPHTSRRTRIQRGGGKDITGPVIDDDENYDSDVYNAILKVLTERSAEFIDTIYTGTLSELGKHYEDEGNIIAEVTASTFRGISGAELYLRGTENQARYPNYNPPSTFNINLADYATTDDYITRDPSPDEYLEDVVKCVMNQLEPYFNNPLIYTSNIHSDFYSFLFDRTGGPFTISYFTITQIFILFKQYKALARGLASAEGAVAGSVCDLLRCDPAQKMAAVLTAAVAGGDPTSQIGLRNMVVEGGAQQPVLEETLRVIGIARSAAPVPGMGGSMAAAHVAGIDDSGKQRMVTYFLDPATQKTADGVVAAAKGESVRVNAWGNKISEEDEWDAFEKQASSGASGADATLTFAGAGAGTGSSFPTPSPPEGALYVTPRYSGFGASAGSSSPAPMFGRPVAKSRGPAFGDSDYSVAKMLGNDDLGGGARKTRSRKSRGSSRKSRNNHKNKTRKGNNRKYNRRTRRRS
jgi:hypothetical protein